MQFETNVQEIIRRNYNVKSFRFYRPAKFEYKPGQCLLITIHINGKEAKKYFTISSSPTQKTFLEFTQKLTGNKFSNALENLKKGDWTRIEGPFSNFSFDGEFKKVGMLTGGIGITPCRSMIRYCMDQEIDCNIVLLYSNRTEEDIVFKEEFDQIHRQNRNIKIVYTLTRAKKQWNGYSRRIDKEMILEEIPDFKERIFFIFGPPNLVSNMEKILDKINVDKKNIRKENFSG